MQLYKITYYGKIDKLVNCKQGKKVANGSGERKGKRGVGYIHKIDDNFVIIIYFFSHY